MVQSVQPRPVAGVRRGAPLSSLGRGGGRWVDAWLRGCVGEGGSAGSRIAAEPRPLDAVQQSKMLGAHGIGAQGAGQRAVVQSSVCSQAGRDCEADGAARVRNSQNATLEWLVHVTPSHPRPAECEPSRRSAAFTIHPSLFASDGHQSN